MLKKLLSDPASKWICLGWAGFTLENLILSENRTEIIEYFDNANIELKLLVINGNICKKRKYFFKIKKKIDFTVKEIIKFEPDILFSVDSPDFTLRVAERVKKINANINLK